MRKLLSLLLALTMLASTMSVAFAAPADVTDEDQMEAVEVLMALGVVDGYPDGTYRPDNTVTRAEMAKLIVTILGYADIANADATSFTDMGSHWAKGYVEVCVGLGIVKGYTDGSFKPDAVVTYNEAATMIIRALGYTDEALGGTWPTNYVTKAMDKEVFDDVSTLAGGANRGDIAIMLFNALPLNIGTVDQDGDYEEEDGDTMIARLDGSNYSAVVYGDEDTLINLRAYVGQYSDIYEYDGDIILVLEDSDILVGDYDISDEELDADDDVSYNLDLDTDADEDSAEDILVFNNGDYDYAATTMADVEDPITATTGVDIDNMVFSGDVSGVTIKEAYAFNIWTVSADFLFDDNDDADDIADDQELGGFDFMLDDDEVIDEDSFVIVGADSLDDIEEDDVVYVYKGDDYIRRVAVGTEVVEGEITKINSDGDEFTIDGTTYEVSPEVSLSSLEGDIEDEVEIKLDAFGYIYDMDIVDADTDYAVVVDLGKDSNTFSNDYDGLVKLVLADGSSETFEIDEDAEDMNDTTEDMDDYFASDLGTWDDSLITSGDIVEYSVDDDGEIDGLTAFTATSMTEETISSSGYLDGTKLAEAVAIWENSDQDFDDAGDYDVIDRDDMLDTEDVDGYYVVDEDDNRVVAIVVTSSTSASDDVYGIIDDYATVGDDEYELDFILADGTEVTYTYDSSSSPSGMVGDGNLYLIEFDSDTEIDSLTAVTASNNTDFDTDGEVLYFEATSTSAVIADLDDEDIEFVSGADIEIDGSVSTDLTKTVSDTAVYVDWDSTNTDYDDTDASESDVENSDALTVKMWDVIGDDGVYDVLMIVNPD